MDEMHLIFTVGVTIAMVVYVVVGMLVGKKVSDTDDYYVGGRGAGTVLIVGSLVASFLSTGAFLGDTGEAASGSFITICIVGLVQGCGYIYGAILFGRYIRRSRCLTLPEYYGKRFNSKRMRKLAGLTCIIACLAYMLSALRGITSLMMAITGLPEIACLLIAWATFTFFTIWSGSPGVLVTGTMMFFVFLVAAIIAIPSIVMNTGGWINDIQTLADFKEIPGIISVAGNPDYIAETGETTAWAVTYGIVWMLVVMVSPWQTSRYMMAKNEHVVIRSAIWSSMGVLTTTILLYFAAVFTATVAPNLGSDTMLWASMNLMPKVVGVILLTGILSAGISSASTFLSLIGFSLVNDLYEFRDTDEKKKLRTSRIGMIIASIISLVLGLFAKQIFWIMYFGGAVIAASWGIISFASIWSKKVSERGAFLSMLLGFLGCFTVRLYTSLTGTVLPLPLDSFMIGIYCAAIGYWVGNATSKPTEVEIKYRESLFIVPEEEKNAKMMRFTFHTYRAHIAFAAGMVLLFVFGWAVPYLSVVGI